MNSKGQTLVEGVMGLLTLAICCQGLIWLFVVIENSMVIHHILYEALICTQVEPKRTDCTSEARSEISQQALGSDLLQVDLKEQENQVTGVVQVRPPWGRTWTLKDNLILPLQVSQ